MSCVLVSLPVLTIPNKRDWEIKGTFPGWLSAAFFLNLSTGPYETVFANFGIRVNLMHFEYVLKCSAWFHIAVQDASISIFFLSLSNKNWYVAEINVINMTDKRKKDWLFFFFKYCFPSSKASSLALNHNMLVKRHAVVTVVLDV